jgi:hypothetical protein
MSAAAAQVVPESAVLDSGEAVVLLDVGEGRYEPREVKLGADRRRYEVLSGLSRAIAVTRQLCSTPSQPGAAPRSAIIR